MKVYLLFMFAARFLSVLADVKYKEVGCFNERIGNYRALSVFIKNFRGGINWRDLKTSVVDKCAEVAKDKGYTYFGIQFYGECWSGPNAEDNYDKHGPSQNCWYGVGGQGVNMVYRIVN